MEQTANYGLNQWAAGDRIMREDFNTDNAKIDQALERIRTAAGNCKVVTGSYVGTGTYGSSSPTTLTFEGSPFLVIVAGSRGFTALRPIGGTSTFSVHGGEPYGISLSWDTNTLSWYGSNTAEIQCNTKDSTYHYCAFFLTE